MMLERLTAAMSRAWLAHTLERLTAAMSRAWLAHTFERPTAATNPAGASLAGDQTKWLLNHFGGHNITLRRMPNVVKRVAGDQGEGLLRRGFQHGNVADIDNTDV